MSNCVCAVCKRPMDCNGDVCELCECDIEERKGIQLQLPLSQDEIIDNLSEIIFKVINGTT